MECPCPNGNTDIINFGPEHLAQNCHGRLRAELVEFNGDYIEEALLHFGSEQPRR
jgi:NADH:ubiquinone oxidoreductase subunit D